MTGPWGTPYVLSSWYAQGSGASEYYNYGKKNAQDLSAHVSDCSADFLATIVFGQPNRHANLASSGYEGYGVTPFGDSHSFLTFAQIRDATMAYEQGYRSVSPAPCPTLKLVVSVTNENTCATHSTAPDSCDTKAVDSGNHGVGVNFRNMLLDVVRMSDSAKYGASGRGQIFLWAGGDFEVAYGTYARTYDIANAFTDSTANAHFEDLGYAAGAGGGGSVKGKADCGRDADRTFSPGGQAAGWTDYHMYCMFYGLKDNYGLPQVYLRGQLPEYGSLYSEFGLIYSGVLTDNPSSTKGRH